MLDRHSVRAAGQGEGFDQFDTSELGRLKPHDQLFTALAEGALTWHDRHECLVRWESASGRASDQPSLCQIGTVFAIVEQNKTVGLVGHADVLEKLGLHQRPALSVERELENIGCHYQALMDYWRCPGLGDKLVCSRR